MAASTLSSLGFVPSGAPAGGAPASAPSPMPSTVAPVSGGTSGGSSGAGDLSNLGFVPSSNSGSTAPNASGSGQSTGFLQSAAQSIAKPFLQMTRLPAGLIDEGLGYVTGNKTLQENGAAAASNQPYNFGYLGSVDAAGYGDNGQKLSLPQAIAQAAGAGLQIAPWFVGAGEAEPLVEGAQGAAAAAEGASTASKVGTAATNIVKGAAAGAGIGAAQGGGAELQRQGETGNFNAGQLATATGGGALAGGVTGGVLSSAGELGSQLLDSLSSNTPGSRLADQANRLKTLTNAIADSKTNPIDTITDMMKGSKTPLLSVIDGKVQTEALETALDSSQASINAQAKQIVAGMTGRVSIDDFQTAVEDAIKDNPTIRGSGGVQKALAKVQNMFSDYARTYGDDAGTMTYQALNEIRTSMNKYFDPETVDIERSVANAARQYLYDSDSGSPELKGLMAQWGRLEDAQNFADKLRGTAVKGGRLGKYLADMVGSGVGGAVGSTFGPFGTAAGAAAGGIVTDKVASALQGSYFNPMLSAPASTLSRFVGSAPVQAAAAGGSQALERAFAPQPQR